jgi:hypothetical protein
MRARARSLASPSAAAAAVLTAVLTAMVTLAATLTGAISPASADGGAGDATVLAFGAMAFHGSTQGQPLTSRLVAVAATPDGGGYWLAAADGGVFNYGDAHFLGSIGGTPLARPIVGMAAAPDGAGYWLVASDGGVFAFGTAHFLGSAAGLPLRRPIVGMAATPSGHGYWLVASDGGVFSYGDAAFFGSTGGLPLVRPVVGMSAAPDGLGYRLVASDGGIFSYGSARFFGSTGGVALAHPVVGMAPTPSGAGYWLVGSDGGIFSYGDAGYFGSAVGQVAPGNVALGIAAPRTGSAGYVVAMGPPARVHGPFGSTVADLQRRLNALGYWVPVDGAYGALTTQAVYALEKAAGLPRRGTVGPAERAALEDGVQPTPRTGFGYVVELDKTRQLLMVVLDGTPLFTFNTSTGTGAVYYSGGQRAVAYTPEGRFAVYRTVNGLDISPLGELWRPRYFTGGYAIHGSNSIPPYPASHGCARLSNAATDFIWAAGLMPIGTPVWVYR